MFHRYDTIKIQHQRSFLTRILSNIQIDKSILLEYFRIFWSKLLESRDHDKEFPKQDNTILENNKRSVWFSNIV